MNDKYSVSVIVPCYNSEKTIQQTLWSILDQTRKPEEIIVVDDGSTDGSSERVNAFIQQELEVSVRLFRQENKGVSAARNRGVQESSGDLVCFLDADDLWQPDKLDKQLVAMAQADAGFRAVSVIGVRRFIESESGVREYLHQTVISISPMLSRSERMKKVLSLVNAEMAITSTFLCPKSVFWEVGGWDTTLKLAEDWDLLLRLCDKLPLISVAEPLLLYRKHSASVTARFDNLASLERQQSEMLLRYSRVAGLIPSEFKALYKIHILDFLGSMQNVGSIPERIHRMRLLLRLVCAVPLILRERIFYHHIKKTLMLGE